MAPSVATTSSSSESERSLTWTVRGPGNRIAELTSLGSISVGAAKDHGRTKSDIIVRFGGDFRDGGVPQYVSSVSTTNGSPAAHIEHHMSHFTGPGGLINVGQAYLDWVADHKDHSKLTGDSIEDAKNSLQNLEASVSEQLLSLLNSVTGDSTAAGVESDAQSKADNEIKSSAKWCVLSTSQLVSEASSTGLWWALRNDGLEQGLWSMEFVSQEGDQSTVIEGSHEGITHRTKRWDDDCGMLLDTGSTVNLKPTGSEDWKKLLLGGENVISMPASVSSDFKGVLDHQLLSLDPASPGDTDYILKLPNPTQGSFVPVSISQPTITPVSTDV